VPLSRLQREVLGLLAANRDPESYVAGAIVLNQDGPLFLKDGVPVQPDPDQLSACTEHMGRRRGHWPSSSEIGSAMLGGDDQADAGTAKR
jgi:hypothetical protein